MPIDKTSFVFGLKDLKKINLEFTKEFSELDFKLGTNYNSLSNVPSYNTNISIGSTF